MDAADKERALRAHIRKLLLRYALTHLTINYVDYTRTEVSELLSDCLSVVPLDDPTSLVLPVDPFEQLYQKLKIEDQKPYDQTWTVADETRQWVQDTLGNGNGREPPTDRCWRTVDESTYTNPVRPMSPILTTRAIRQTPRIGGASSSSTLIKSFRHCNPKYLEYVDIKPVANEPFEEVVFSARERDQILNAHPRVDQEMLGAMASLLARVPNAKLNHTSIHDRVPSMVSKFISDEASPPLANAPCPMSPPIFPRQLGVVRTPGMRKPSEIHSLGFVSQVKVEEEAEDISKAHMLLVDGWNVLAPPPASPGTPDTPSLDAGSQSSRVELDELFALTPPPQQPFARLLTDEKMEEYLVPRTCKPGGGGKKGHGECKPSLSTFLSPLLPSVPASFKPNTPDSRLHQSPPVSLSLQGHPSSPAKSSATSPRSPRRLIAKQESSSDVGLHALVAQLCAPVDGQSAEDFIMQERIEEEEALMMDIPKLKEPYLHPTSTSTSRPTLPASVRSLVSSKKPKPQASANKSHEPDGFPHLKKVAGVQSLNIELPWRPFNFGTSIPRTEELADVEHHPTLSLQAGLDDDADDEVKKLLAAETPGAGADGRLRAICDEPAMHWAAGEDWGRYDVILTRAERGRVSGYDTAGARDRNDAFEDSSGWEEGQGATRPHSKRRKVDSTPGFDLTGDSEAHQAIEPVQDVGAAPFSFNTLCSPGQGGLSQDAPYWNHAGEGPESEIGGSNLLENQWEPIWTAESAALSASLVDNHSKSASGGTFGSNQAGGSPPIAQDISPRKISAIRSLDAVLPARDAHPSSALPVSAKPPPNRLSSFRRSEEDAAQEYLTDFVRLRGKSVRESVSVLSPQPEPEPEPAPELPIDLTSSPRPVPPELADANTLSLPDEWVAPTSRHRYIASLDVLQKTILRKHLASPDCRVELAERDAWATNGVDLILDPDTALLLVPLAPLSVSGEALTEKIAKLSWDFARLVVVFEAFSTSSSYRTESGAGLAPYAFPPAIMKAIRKFKWTVAILDGMATGNKRRETEVRYGYARDVGEAARLVRLAGDMAEKASGASLGDGRDWLVDEYHEDEVDLAQAKGMNVYAAAMILHYVDLNTFIDMEPGRRVEMFSAMVGAQRIAMLNEVIANRLAEVGVSSPAPVSPAASSFKPAEECFEDTSGDGGRYVGMSGEDGGSSHRQGVQEDGMAWQTTGLLVIPGRVEQTASAGWGKRSNR
ncbi:hypothetical protein JB92DRAFT_3100288 [Gautieria morchelliformis]|nr:hypothetical protein JB92DRAFT_3100288 [Gautieria morchelliformis]